MILSITKIELNSYFKIIAFFKFNGQIIKQLQSSPCKKYKVTGSANLKVWYTMTLWETDDEINQFYRNGVHLEAMKQSKIFSSNIQSKRVTVENSQLGNWKEFKKLFS